MTRRPAVGGLDAARRQLFIEAVRRAGHNQEDLVGVAIRPSIRASSARLHEVDLELRGGRRLELLFKELGRRGLMPAARESKPLALHDPEREIVVYEKILANRDLGTPLFYAGRSDRRLGVYWLLIERVDAPQLQWTTDPDAWSRSVAWLAAAHSALAPAASDAPIRCIGPSQLARWLQRARRFGAPAERAGRRRLAWVASRYARAVDVLVAAPRSVTHGQLYPSNVLAEDRPGGRVAVIDWEMAAVGPAVMDLAALVTGLPPDTVRADLETTYIETLEPVQQLGLLDLGLRRAVDAARVAMAIQWLGWSRHWTPPADQVFDWLTEAIEATEALA